MPIRERSSATSAARADSPLPVTVGVTGLPVRASVSAWGDVTSWGAAAARPEPTLSWHVAADDRWHVPAAESTVRQARIDGTPVVETRLRVPDGDAVQRVWGVADHGGMIIVEITNESPLPFAVAFSGAPVLTRRPPSDVPVRGIELPADAIVLPVGHHASVRVGLASTTEAGSPGDGPLPPVADPAAVVRGWRTIADRAGRLELPDPVLGDLVVAARCDLLLDGPVGPRDDPAGFLLDVGELVRLGEDAAAWLPDVVGPVAEIARDRSPHATAALVAARRVARAAADERAGGDLDRLLHRRGPGRSAAAVGLAELRRGASAGRFVHDVESLFATGGALLPHGFPTPWLGRDFEVATIPTGPDSTVSYAVRWHGERPALLWEQGGPPVVLTSPSIDPEWSSADPSGEALWAAPPARRSLPVTPA